MFDISALEAENTPQVTETSSPFVGRWNRLVSTTNWEKGRIICEWRQALIDGGAPFVSSTDEAWSRQVGGISPQHAGRLRRVFERFGETHEQYPGLFWSHFFAALDWPDAEMWLQGAIDNDWSIGQMRDQRWEAHGAAAELKPRESEIIATEAEEESHPLDSAGASSALAGVEAEVRDIERGDADRFDLDAEASFAAADPAVEAFAESSAAAVRPFENLPVLPDDLKEAFELFKLAILSHKISGWSEIGREQVLGVLESLKRLALAPAE
ncbi:MAG: hypothetical protein IT426_04790 [Pirellulales bacterium]|nr:hypothetical protein [Pirellulales bacterium]